MNKPMDNQEETRPKKPYTLIHNWVSLLGIPMATFGFVVGMGLIILDVQNAFSSPYLGIFTYLVVPVILSLGLLLILVGVLRERRHRRVTGKASLSRMPVINLNDQRHFYAFIVVVVVTFLFFTLSGIGSYRAYHFTESVTFCGTTCHSVMKPEYTAYQNSPHANVLCTKCHIGPGADFFVKSKLNGLYQVYSTIFDKYSRPIQAPVHNLRPAKETCYTCHWPEKFFGAVERSRTYFATDEENTPWSIRMLIKVGGGNPEHGPVQGIHWHMVTGNKVEYAAIDEKRQVIPWVRQTDLDGNVTVYKTEDEEVDFHEGDLTNTEVRVMDCIDCHNRPTHRYHSPNFSLDLAMSSGAIDTSIPWVKMIASDALLGDYASEDEAMEGIDKAFRDEYTEGGENVEEAIEQTKRIYRNNFFPEMGVRWSEYPDNIGHYISDGCFRCHDGLHVSESGKRISNDCNACHTVLAQGNGTTLEAVTTSGLEFEHPGGNDLMEGVNCSECHNGAPE